MASLCILHNDLMGSRGAFQALPTVDAELTDFVGARRSKIWELSGSLHCSIIGTCLTAGELRLFFVRFGDSDARTASDHALHGRGVRAASRRDDGGKLLNKALDKRHESAIRQFAKAKSAAQLRAFWTQALDQGDIAGPYWALLTHPVADAKLVQDVFGDVHMLSHQVGAAARLDIARLRRLETELGERDDKIARQQARLAAAARERISLREAIERLEATLAGFEAAPSAEAPREVDDLAIERLRRELADERARSASLVEKLRLSEKRRGEVETERLEATLEARRCLRELAALEAAFAQADESEDSVEPGGALLGANVLYVGGRPKLVEQLAAFVAARGGELRAHDGGVEDSLALLPGLVSQADFVYFPVDCVSHSAVEKVKKLCQRLAKPWAPLRSASLASFVAEVVARDEIRGGRLPAAAE